MAKYKVIKAINFGSGYIQDKTGKSISVNSFAPKVGDEIELDSTIVNLAGTRASGYNFLIKQEGVSGSKVLIPIDSVEILTTETKTKPKSKNILTVKNITIGLVGIGVILGVLKITKVI